METLSVIWKTDKKMRLWTFARKGKVSWRLVGYSETGKKIKAWTREDSKQVPKYVLKGMPEFFHS